MPVPVITSATSATGTVYSSWIYYITATNSPVNNGYGASLLPPWASLRYDGAILGTPTTPGTFDIVLQASNGSGSSPEVTLTLTIAPAAGAPAITSATSANGTVGTAFSYQGAATNAPTSYSLTTMLAGQAVAASVPGLTFSTATGLLSGTPTAAGTYNVSLSAANANGPGAAVSLSVVIAAAPAETDTGSFTVAPTNATLGVVTVGSTVQLAFQGSGTNFGSGTTFNASAGTLTGVVVTSATQATGNYTAPGTNGNVTFTLDASSITATLPVYASGGAGTGGGGTGGGGTTITPGDGTGTGVGYNTGQGTVVTFIGRLILGLDVSGAFITAGAVITEMLQYVLDSFTANGLEPAFQIGAIDPGYLIPLDEVKDVTCTEVFRKMARWMPDCMQWFDYTTTPPTIHFRLGGSGGTATLTVGKPPLVSLGEIKPLNDLVAPAVVIHYELTTTVNGAASLTLLTDAAPAGATGREFGTVVLTIPVRGQSSTSVQQRINTTAIKDQVGASGLVAYLAGRCAALGADVNDSNITADGITITSCTRGLADDTAEKYDPDTGEYAADADYDDSLGFELVDGAFTDWMVKNYALKKQVHRIIFEWTADSGSDDAPNVSGTKKGAFDLVATNASGQVYTAMTNYNQGDTVPAGLAASYLATLAKLHWSGQVELIEQTAGKLAPSATLGSFLNIAGSANAAWATMNALVVGEQVQASTGRTTLTLGPPMHLSPQDLVARMHITRPGGTGGRQDTGAKGTTNSDARSTGQPGGNNTVAGSTAGPIKGGGSLISGGAGGTPTQPFSLVSADDKSGAHVRVLESNLVGDLPSGFTSGDNPPYVLDVSDGDIVYGCVTWDVSGQAPGDVTSRTLGIGQTVPTDDPSNGTFYYRIGSVAVSNGKSTPSNDAYGPIDATCYRPWFTNPKTAAVAWNAAT